jgi:hypothetical protein
VGSAVVCRVDEGSVVAAEASVTVGVALEVAVCSASLDVVVVDWSTEAVGDDEELSVGVTVWVVSWTGVVADAVEVSVVVAGAVD